MMVSLGLLLLCAVATLTANAQLLPSVRNLEGYAVKVHVQVHSEQADAMPKLENVSQRAHKSTEQEETMVEGETVRKYSHGTVRIGSSGGIDQKLAKGYIAEAEGKKSTKETRTTFEHGSVKISDMKPTKGSNTRDNTLKVAQFDEKVVTSTASSNHKSLLDSDSPVVVICGIIGGLTVIIGVASLVMSSNKNNVETDSTDATGFAIDVEGDVSSQETVKDKETSDRELSDEVEEEGTFANNRGHVSV